MYNTLWYVVLYYTILHDTVWYHMVIIMLYYTALSGPLLLRGPRARRLVRPQLPGHLREVGRPDLRGRAVDRGSVLRALDYDFINYNFRKRPLTF